MKRSCLQKLHILWLICLATGMSASFAHAQTNVSGNIPGPVTWDLQGSPYIVQGDVTISGGALTIDPKVVVKFNGNYFIDGQILADGQTPDAQIVFTSNQGSPTQGYWNYIRLSAGSVIKFAVIEYGKWGLYANSAGAVTIENNTIQNNDRGIYQVNTFTSDVKFNTIINNDYGIYSSNGNGASGQWLSGNVTNNSIYSNNVYNFYAENSLFAQPPHRVDAGNNWWGTTDPSAIIDSIRDSVESPSAAAVDIRPILDGPSGNPINTQYIYGWMNANETWIQTASPYIVLADTFVNSGITLTIQPGTLVKFDGHYILGVEPSLQQATINAQGTLANPIIFTSNKTNPAKNDWNYLQLSSSSILKYAVLEYSQWGVYSDGASPTVENNTIRDNGRGIYQKGAFTADIKFNAVTNNDYGIYSQNLAGGLLTGAVNSNDIHSNAVYDFYTTPGTPGYHVIDASNNWWGTTDPQQIVSHIYDYQEHLGGSSVHFSPFLNASGGTAIGANVVQGLFDQSETWTAAVSPYDMIDDIIFAPGTTLTVNPGVTVRAANDASLTMEGTLTAQGQQGQTIIFTSLNSTPQAGDWQGIALHGNQTINHNVEYCRIEYADTAVDLNGSFTGVIKNNTIQNSNTGIVRQGSTTPQIEDNVLQDNGTGLLAYGPMDLVLLRNKIINNQTGLLLNGQSASQPATGRINTNEIYDNQVLNVDLNYEYASLLDILNNWWGTVDGIAIRDSINGAEVTDFVPFWDGPGGNSTGYQYKKGPITQNETWTTALSPYYIMYDVTIASGVTVTVNPGVAVRFDGPTKMQVDGTLDAQGTNGQRIAFTSNKGEAAPGDWEYIDLSSSSIIKYSDIEYSQFGLRMDGTSPVIENNILKKNGYAMYLLNQASPGIQNNRINLNNKGIGIVPSVSNPPNPTISNNLFFDNAVYHLEANPVAGAGTLTITAQNNWWGTTVISEINQKIYDLNDDPNSPAVNYVPFLNSPGTAFIPITNVSAAPQFINLINNQTSTVSYNLGFGGFAILKIKNFETNAMVRTIVSPTQQSAGANNLVWDGKDDANQLLPDGIYSYRLEVFDPVNSNFGEYDPLFIPNSSVQLQGTSSLSATAFDPYKGENLGIQYNLVAPARVSVLAGPQIIMSPHSANVVFKKPRPMTGNVEKWDGRDFNGNFVLPETYLAAVDSELLPENSIVIQNAQPVIDYVQSNPYAIRPIYGEVSEIKYRLTVASNVTVVVKDPNGNVLQTLVNNQQQASGEQTVLWDGRDQSGNYMNTEGDYRVEVTAEDLSGLSSYVLSGTVRVFE